MEKASSKSAARRPFSNARPPHTDIAPGYVNSQRQSAPPRSAGSGTAMLCYGHAKEHLACPDRRRCQGRP